MGRTLQRAAELGALERPAGRFGIGVQLAALIFSQLVAYAAYLKRWHPACPTCAAVKVELVFAHTPTYPDEAPLLKARG